MELIGNIIKKENHVEKEITESATKCKYCGKPYKNIKVTCIVGGIKREPKYFDEPDCNCSEKEQLAQIERNETEKRIKRSNITPKFKKATFETLNNNLSNAEELLKCKSYAQNFCKSSSKGIQMIGITRAGKTTLLAAICNYLIERKYNCLIITFSELLSKFTTYSKENAGDIRPLLTKLGNFDFIVLDDIGRESYTAKRKEIAFQIIDYLYNYEVITAITANPESIQNLKSIPEWAAPLGRLNEMCPIKFEFRDKVELD